MWLSVRRQWLNTTNLQICYSYSSQKQQSNESPFNQCTSKTCFKMLCMCQLLKLQNNNCKLFIVIQAGDKNKKEIGHIVPFPLNVWSPISTYFKDSALLIFVSFFLNHIKNFKYETLSIIYMHKFCFRACWHCLSLLIPTSHPSCCILYLVMTSPSFFYKFMQLAYFH